MIVVAKGCNLEMGLEPALALQVARSVPQVINMVKVMLTVTLLKTEQILTILFIIVVILIAIITPILCYIVTILIMETVVINRIAKEVLIRDLLVAKDNTVIKEMLIVTAQSYGQDFKVLIPAILPTTITLMVKMLTDVIITVMVVSLKLNKVELALMCVLVTLRYVGMRTIVKGLNGVRVVRSKGTVSLVVGIRNLVLVAAINTKVAPKRVVL
jgi:hypothetical protein